MKKKQYNMSKTKKQLLYLKNRGVKQVIWEINSPEIRDEIVRMGCSLEPWIISIKTRPFANIRSIEHLILKDVHYAFKRGKIAIGRQCNISDCKILDDYGVKYRISKYMVILN